jgi:hypothetical protein
MTLTHDARLTVPDDLRERDQWVVWRYEVVDGKVTKVPYQVNGRRAKTNDPRTWATFDAAVAALETGDFDGAGYVFAAEDPNFGVDVDDCLDVQGRLKDWAKRIVERFADTYAEISPSGKGLKFWAKGCLPGGAGAVFPLGDGQVEIYDRGRYFAVTGQHWMGPMLDVEEHQADVGWLLGLARDGQRTAPFKIAEADGKIPKGRQHHTLVSVAVTMRKRAVCGRAILGALEIINREQCEEPGPIENIRKIAEWAGRLSIGPGGASAPDLVGQQGSGVPVHDVVRRQILYCADELTTAKIVFIANSEREVEALRSHGFVATTVIGEHAPRSLRFTGALTGREVILILNDNATDIRRLARIATELLGTVSRLVFVELDGAHSVSDWFAAGHSEVELIALVETGLVRCNDI